MSLTSKYVIDLEIQDKNDNAIRSLEKELREVGEIAKKSIKSADLSSGMKDTKKAVKGMMAQLDRMAKDTSIDIDAITKAYSKGTARAMDALNGQYALLKEKLDEAKKSNAENSNELQYQIQYQIDQNRELRAKIKATERNLIFIRQEAKIEEAQNKLQTAKGKTEQKNYTKKVQQEQKLLKLMQQELKVQLANEKTLSNAVVQAGKFTKAIDNARKAASLIGKATQFASNATNIGRGIVQFGDRNVKMAKTAVKGGIGLARGVASSVSMVTGAADQEVERERAVNRIKGLDAKTADKLLGEIYVQTGADYSTIVEAINRVRGVLKGVRNDELAQAVAIEIRYPGLSTLFASQNMTPLNAGSFRTYASALNDIQNATGASAEQIVASAQVLANRKDIQNTGGKISEYQTVYLAMQNSGAFESEDELESVFSTFVQKQKNSGKGVFEFAKDFKLADYVYGAQNKQQAMIADQHLDWQSISEAEKKHTKLNWKNISDIMGFKQEKTAAESTAIKMRELEIKKNELMIKLIPAVVPLVEAVSEVLSSGGAQGIVDGMSNLFTKIIPLLEPVIKVLGTVLNWINEYVMPKAASFFEGAVSTIKDFGQILKEKFTDTTLENSAGGLALMPSIVGERGPEAIIPLDFARTQRASNIATSINQTFNMGSNATTALSLAQTVRSRDFTRAMAENAFITRRCGVF